MTYSIVFNNAVVILQKKDYFMWKLFTKYTSNVSVKNIIILLTVKGALLGAHILPHSPILYLIKQYYVNINR